MPLSSLRVPLIFAFLAAFAPAGLHAQTQVQTGARVRVFAPSAADTLLAGTVTSLDSASLLVVPAPGAAPVRVPLARVERLEVSRGRAPSTAAGAVTGLIVGAVGGYGIARLAGDPEECEFVCGAAETGMAVLGGGLGLLIGALIGAETPHGPERWEPVPVRP